MDEIKGEEEYNEELRARKGMVEDAPFEFNDSFAPAEAKDSNFGGNLVV
jgi:hypothetical protein